MSKLSITQLEEILRDRIGHTWDTSVLTSAKAKTDYSLYELFVFTLVLEAAEELGAPPAVFKTLSGGSAVVTSAPDFKTGPHDLWSDGDVWADLTLPGRRMPFEVHIGVCVEGKSGVPHECDVSVLRARTAERCRTSKITPKSHELVIAAECKYYAQRIGIGMAREFLGLRYDLTVPSVANHVAVNSPFVTDAQRLLYRHRVLGHDSLVPKLKSGRTPQIESLIDQCKVALQNYR
ncbi:MAG: hypothetical protein IT298_17385 [Chloroflexi bacterium]|nr:hypothetical protein [Chloroflexota bacterium]RIK20116.1 MAG: hypothetical protein DCC53_11525 [Chloroflexota bacterium]